jgi:hypothetical protein
MNLMISPDEVIVSAPLGGLVVELRQFSQLGRLAGRPRQHLMSVSGEARSRHSIALWRQYSKLIYCSPTPKLGSDGLETPRCFKGSVSSAKCPQRISPRSVRFSTQVWLAHVTPLMAGRFPSRRGVIECRCDNGDAARAQGDGRPQIEQATHDIR